MERGPGRVEREIVGDEQVEIAVAVVIGEGRTQAPEAAADPGLGRDVGETAAIVPPERVAAVARHVDVGVAVAVVIGHGHPLAVAPGRQPRRCRDVLEPPAALVPQQDVRRAPDVDEPDAIRRRPGRQQRSALGEEQVEPAVAVVVEQSDAPPVVSTGHAAPVSPRS